MGMGKAWAGVLSIMTHRRGAPFRARPSEFRPDGLVGLQLRAACSLGRPGWGALHSWALVRHRAERQETGGSSGGQAHRFGWGHPWAWCGCQAGWQPARPARAGTSCQFVCELCQRDCLGCARAALTAWPAGRACASCFRENCHRTGGPRHPRADVCSLEERARALTIATTTTLSTHSPPPPCLARRGFGRNSPAGLPVGQTPSRIASRCARSTNSARAAASQPLSLAQAQRRTEKIRRLGQTVPNQAGWRGPAHILALENVLKWREKPNFNARHQQQQPLQANFRSIVRRRRFLAAAPR